VEGALILIRLTFVLGYGGSMIPVLVNALEEFKKNHPISYTIITPYKYNRESIKHLKESDVVFIYSSQLPDEVEEALKSLPGKCRVIAVDENHANLSSVDLGTLRKAFELIRLGGYNNLRLLVMLMLKLVGVIDVDIPEPVKIPWHGIYHPKYGVFSSVEDYLKVYPYTSRPLIGLLLYRSDWIYGRIGLIDKLISYLEDLGLGVIPVFTYSFHDVRLNSPSSEDSIRKFFFLNDKPLIEVLVKLTSFFLLDHGASNKWTTEGFNVVSGVELLKKLNVPIIQCIISYSKSPEEWLRDEHGLDYMSIVYRISMPEVDGVIEPIMVAGTVIGDYGEKKVIPIDEHLRYLARRIKKWVEVRRKKPCERRIAIILINPPCKGVEANVAVGLGLDVPESVVRFLRKLKEEGYNVGDYIPANGEELVKMIMSRRAISEFRWTSVEEIVARGGALDFVDEDTYTKWFSELPSNIRERMIKEWGHPRNVLAGRVDKVLVGMVYNGKFVVPGLRFGNVIIVPQPKRGCAGARCDGRVCKILHDPTVPPPHQWLAVYRWITRIFKADIVIHFGTHGYLEFLPGKGVGLSWMCWPEISIDDVPHLYVYVVSNPMEGVIAKRRGYAVLVDHLYPPMKFSDVLSDIEGLLTQYSNAKMLGDDTRANIIFEQLVSKARELNIPLPDRVDDQDKVIEAIHKYVHIARNTQINMGLHVLGEPPKNPRELAEYVTTICSFDSYRSPSIIRVLAKYLGLNYNDLRKNPMKINNRFGVRNSELLEILRKITVNVLEKLIKKGNVSDEDVIRILDEEVRSWLKVS